MTENPHFATVETWAEAEELIGFTPLQPAHTEGYSLASLRVHVMDHRMRELSPEQRTLEAHYGGFVVSQSGPGSAEARRLAYEVSYGTTAEPLTVGGHEARAYDEGPIPEPGDPDGQMPAVVVWSDGDRLLLVAGAELDLPPLLRIAESIYR